eukprot:3168093-Pleurochrysis_carterae.AAC.1
MTDESSAIAASTAVSLDDAEEFIPPPQLNWEHLQSLAPAGVRLSEARRRDIWYLTNVFMARKWRSRDVAAALDEADM